jgi:hypothetical protein
MSGCAAAQSVKIERATKKDIGRLKAMRSIKTYSLMPEIVKRELQ